MNTVVVEGPAIASPLNFPSLRQCVIVCVTMLLEVLAFGDQRLVVFTGITAVNVKFAVLTPETVYVP